jgi:hypothetical protein
MFRFLMLLCVSTLPLCGEAPQQQAYRHPLVFEPNRGQAPAGVKWIAQASGYRLLFTDGGATIVLPDAPTEVAKEHSLPALFRLPLCRLEVDLLHGTNDTDRRPPTDVDGRS